jgi:hypothetical protein
VFVDERDGHGQVTNGNGNDNDNDNGCGLFITIFL